MRCSVDLLLKSVDSFLLHKTQATKSLKNLIVRLTQAEPSIDQLMFEIKGIQCDYFLHLLVIKSQ